MTTLLLDVGNSRCKWGLWSSGVLGATGHVDNNALAAAESWHFTTDIEQAFVCNVAGDARGEALRQGLLATGVDATFARVSRECAGVRCAYRDPNRLGVDRWMAVLAASRLPKLPALAIDAGTALTIDALGSDGQHLGGYIIPGLSMMQSALTSRTANIRVDEPQPIDETFGQSTSEAVRHGALVALAGAVSRAAEKLAAAEALECDALQFAFTGGDGRVLAETLDKPGDFHANFVLHGLAIYAGLRA